ncbi:glycosyltransferase [Salinisphaera sp. T31B1]|uniref:glycosyltransferase family 2 protein n=1 Tax=Salinisphaera sp. T31B1 TaxID=727963 RepID=UPI00333EF546
MMPASKDAQAITVSVVVATYNRADYLAKALDSLLAQTRPPDEVLVIDDGSSDATPDLLAAYGSRIRCIRQTNSGKPAALNRAIPQARGTHVWIFDDDDYALPHALATHVRFLEDRPDLDFCYSHNFTFDGDGDITDAARWRTPVAPNYRAESLLLHLMRDCTLVFQGLLVRRQCLVDLSLFDETLGRAEDYDMLLRLARHYRGGFTGDQTFVWRNHGGERGSASERHSNAERTRLFRQYERIIFKRVRERLELSEYVGHQGADGPSLRVDGLIQRADIMFRHDLIDEGASDIEQVLAELEGRPDAARVAAVRAVITRAADIGDPVFVVGAGHRARQLAHAIRGRYRRDCASAAGKGFYWSARRALRQHRHRDAVRLAAAMPQFMWSLVAELRVSSNPGSRL